VSDADAPDLTDWADVLKLFVGSHHNGGTMPSNQWNRVETAFRRVLEAALEKGMDPPQYTEEFGREVLQPLLEQAEQHSKPAEWALNHLAAILRGETPKTTPIEGLAVPPKKKRAAKAPTKPKKSKPAPTPEDEEEEEEDMAQKPAEQFEEVDEEMEGDEEGNDSDELMEEEPQRVVRRTRAAPRVVERIVVQQPTVRRSKRDHRQAAPQRRVTLADKLGGAAERFRVYVRDDDGRRELVNEYTNDDLGDMQMQQFLQEFIDPEYGAESGRTLYEVHQVDARTGQDLPTPHKFSVNSDRGQQQRPPDPFQQVHQAMDLMETLRSRTSRGDDSMTPMLQAAQQKAMNGGDMTSLMMLMMMEKLNKPQHNEEGLLLKLIDRLDKRDRAGQPGSDFGAPGPFPPAPFFMPPPMPVAPPPPESKFMDVAMAKLLNPPSLADSMKEAMAFQQMMGGMQQQSPQMAALLQAVQTLAQEVTALKANGGSAPNGLESAVATFEKVGTMVKALAPQVGAGGGDAGGIGSALQNLITPKLGAALGDALANGFEKQKQQQAGQGQQAPQQQAAPAPVPAQPVAPPPPNPNAPPNPPPPALVHAVQALRVAQTDPVRVERFVSLLEAMFTSGHPYYQRMLQPALESLNEAEKGVEKLTPGRVLAFGLLLELLPAHATPEMADAIIEALAKKFGVAELPKTFTQTRNAWLIDARGQLVWKSGAQPIVLLDGSIAQVEPPAPPVVQVTPPPPPAPTPAPPQLVANTVEIVEPEVEVEMLPSTAPTPPPAPLPLTVEAGSPRPTVPAR
jgi:hypothetical protein